jgi:Bacterial Ig-like domain (group 3)/Abnormal spindle-like microcephaly-assoc'd, ASPM-SPD-2-Hydin
VLLGNGDGTFQAAVVYGTGGSGPLWVSAVDVNGDGKPDLELINATQVQNNLVSVLINTSTTPTATTLASSPNPSKFGQAITFTATVTARPGFDKGVPTGTVTFTNGNANLGSASLNTSGTAVFTSSTLPVGTLSITATYNGSNSFVASTSPALKQVVEGAVIHFSASSVSFGNQTVGIASSAKPITLTNKGNDLLAISSIGITGTDEADFAQTHNCPASLGPNVSCAVSVTFKPTTTGNRTATLSIKDNSPHSPQGVALTGVGVRPAVEFSPTSLSFPTQLIYTTSKTQTAKLTNSGPGILKITKIAVTGPFTQTGGCGSTVNSGGSCTLTVTFKPTAIGNLTGSITITDNAPGGTQAISLKGTATAVELTPSALNFGDQPTGTASLAKTITLTNQSHVTVDITGISIVGTDPGDFSQTHTCGKTVASGASCFIKVVFKPTATGARAAAVSVSDNGGGSPQKISLSGTGT